MDEPSDSWVNSGADNYVEVYDDDDDEDEDEDMVFVWACTTSNDEYQSSREQQPVFPDKCASRFCFHEMLRLKTMECRITQKHLVLV